MMNLKIRGNSKDKLQKVKNYMSNKCIHIAVLADCKKWNLNFLEKFMILWDFFCSVEDNDGSNKVLIITNKDFI
jgi:hypothetical protein